MGNFGLSKADRLHSRKEITKLFEQNNSLFVYPIKLIYAESSFDDGKVLKAAFSVSKRNFKHAVDRNRYKRLLREAYRLNRALAEQTIENQNKQFALMFVYAAKEHNDYKIVENSMQRILQKLIKKL